MIVPSKKTCKTKFISDAIDIDVANLVFDILRNEIPWAKGIKSKSGETRLAYSCKMGDSHTIDSIIIQALQKLNPGNDYAIMGIYLNYYRDGQDWTPNHNHPGSHQLVISLGVARTLELSKKSYQMTSGSAIIFGSGIHGVPKDPNVQGARISIATFMVPVKSE